MQTGPRSIHQPLNMQLFLVLTFLTLVCCVARAEAPASPTPGGASGLEGSILLHGISGGPVTKGVPDSRPLADMTFEVQKEGLTVAAFTTDTEGRFRVSLPPGHYRVIKKDWKSRVGFFGPFQVEIIPGQIRKVAWHCETGMQ